MKQVLPALLICLTGMPLQSSAQNWLSNDFVWTYNIAGGFAGVNELFTMHVDIDTVINGQPCKKIMFNGTTYGNLPPRYAYAAGNRVYTYQAYADSFAILYDFSRLPGDTITVPKQFGTFDYRIEAVDTVTAGNLQLRRQQVRYLQTSGIFSNWEFDILEGIGAVGHPFQDSLPDCSYFFLDDFSFCNSPVDGFDLKFVCFHSSAGDFMPYNLDCLVLDTQDPADWAAFSLRPNPATDWLTLAIVDLPAQALRTQLYNAQGQMLQTIKGLPEQIRISGFRPGIYFLRVELENGQGVVRRFVKI